MPWGSIFCLVSAGILIGMVVGIGLGRWLA